MTVENCINVLKERASSISYFTRKRYVAILQPRAMDQMLKVGKLVRTENHLCFKRGIHHLAICDVYVLT